jgi:hypothetical protein
MADGSKVLWKNIKKLQGPHTASDRLEKVKSGSLGGGISDPLMRCGTPNSSMLFNITMGGFVEAEVFDGVFDLAVFNVERAIAGQARVQQCLRIE